MIETRAWESVTDGGFTSVTLHQTTAELYAVKNHGLVYELIRREDHEREVAELRRRLAVDATVDSRR